MAFSAILKRFEIRLILGAAFGILGALSFSPYNIWLFSLLSLSGLNLILLNTQITRSICIGYVWGIGFFGSGVSWIYCGFNNFSNMPKIVSAICIIVLISYLAIYPAIFSGFLSYFWPSATLKRMVFASPAIWQSTEFLRGKAFTGFPWLQFGYSQVSGPLKGIAPLMGVDGVTFMLMLVSGLISLSIITHRTFYFITLVSIFLFLSSFRDIQWYNKLENKSIKVSLVQGNIPEVLKWNKEQVANIVNTYLKSSRKVMFKSQIMIWPESAIPVFKNQQSYLLKKIDNILKKENTSLITGIINSRKKGERHFVYNSIVALGKYSFFNHDINQYEKNHLVPLGEFIPLKRILQNFLGLFNTSTFSFSAGKYIQPQININKLNITPSICYETLFGEKFKDNFHSNTDFLLSISNDSWFAKSIGPWQHFQITRMRAIELARPIVIGTNNGITAIINPNGTIEKRISPFNQKCLTAILIPTRGITPYAKYGNTLLWILIFIFGFFAIFEYLSNIRFKKRGLKVSTRD